MAYRVVLTREALETLRTVRNPVTRSRISSRIDSLKSEPQQGKPLQGILRIYRSLRAARRRYRIIYRIEEQSKRVLVIAIGLRKGDDHDDIYRAFKRFVSHKGKR